jgi:serine/threonine protein phosphatase PrpC
LVLTIEAAAKTDVGLVRRDNQDSYGSDPDLSLYLVCDGMGGAAGGAVASDLAARTFLIVARQEIEASQNQGTSQSSEVTRVCLCRAVAAANRAVVERAKWDTCYRGMGSTLVGARLTEDRLTVINVGDSRAYLVRDSEAVQLTEDHSYVAERVRLGMMDAAEAAVSSMQSVITRAVGVAADVQPDLYEATVQAGDTLLLASDGLTRHVSAMELGEVLSTAHNAKEACTRLIEYANQHGGSDNITCIVVRIGESELS